MPKFSPLLLLALLVPPLLLAGCAGGVQKGAEAEAVAVSAAANLATNLTKHPKTLRVRTTAYTGRRNAIGKPVSLGPVISAAADWSRFPLGTRFRIRQTGKTYVVDDYGSALVGTETIDLLTSSVSVARRWGVRWVDIEILEWGSPRRSLEVLTPRAHVRHVRPMLAALRAQSEGIPKRFHRVDR